MNTLLDPHETGRATLHHRLDSQEDTYGPAASHQPEHDSSSRELTLGTTTILTLFFALAILCAAFFAFGYSLGSKHAASTISAPAASAPIFEPLQGSSKPAPGSPAASAGKVPAPAALPPETVTVPATPPAVTIRPAPSSSSQGAAEPSASPSPGVAGSASVVQVAAVSHQEDAELIASTLKRRGYAVVIRSEPQDKLLHLQLGPFANRKDAEAMRLRLLADGFNAYIK